MALFLQNYVQLVCSITRSNNTQPFNPISIFFSSNIFLLRDSIIILIDHQTDKFPCLKPTFK